MRLILRHRSFKAMAAVIYTALTTYCRTLIFCPQDGAKCSLSRDHDMERRVPQWCAVYMLSTVIQ